MSRFPLGLAAAREAVASSLWFWPSLAVLAALALGTALSTVRVDVPDDPPSLVDLLVAGGGSQAARGLLETVASSVITITSLVFSVTVVALQLASTAYSPRLLQGFLRDRGNQVVLSVFLATFAYSYAVLRTVPSDGVDPTVPILAVNALLPFVLASLAALVYFIHHLTQALRIEEILDGVQDATLEAIARILPEDESESVHEQVLRPPSPTVPARARKAGVVQARDLGRLGNRAAKAGLVIRLRHLPGEHVLGGAALADIWRCDGGPIPDDQAEEFERWVRNAVRLGRERILAHDVAFGLRQLADIAVRALSPGTNDPTTAVDTLNRIATVLAELARRPLGPEIHRDEEGNVVVTAPRPSFADLLDTAVRQIGVYGAGDPFVMQRLVQVLGHLGELVTEPGRQAAIAEQLDRVETGARTEMTRTADIRVVEEALASVRGSLAAGRL